LNKSTIAPKLLVWFDEFGRKNLPWQIKPVNPYFVWLSEVMLQQTQVVTVIDYFNNFIKVFPTLKSLASAKEDEVLAQWAGLGYYARARNLHKTAKTIVDKYQGNFPQKFDEVIALAGIGESTAGAILSLSFNQHYAILDGNVKRVLARFYEVEGHYGQSETLKKLWQLARENTPKNDTDKYTQAIMDLGATICIRTKPKCEVCPISEYCQARKNNTQNLYPNPKLKKEKPTKSVAMLVFKNDQKIYLEKRPNKGIWGGLWSFVECDNEKEIIDKTIKSFDCSAIKKQELPKFKHTFSHYHLWIYPIIIECQKDKNFYQISSLKLGVPSPIKKIIKQL
jgi:A/G-specific adenine glycosylase